MDQIIIQTGRKCCCDSALRKAQYLAAKEENSTVGQKQVQTLTADVTPQACRPAYILRQIINQSVF